MERSARRAHLKKIATYVSETEGRAREYWDEWCKDVAAAYNLKPAEVSALHLCIVPDDYIPF